MAATPFEEVALMAADLLVEVEGRLTDPDADLLLTQAYRQVNHVAEAWAKLPDDHDPDLVYAGATFALGLLFAAVQSFSVPRQAATYLKAIDDAEYHGRMLR